MLQSMTALGGPPELGPGDEDALGTTPAASYSIDSKPASYDLRAYSARSIVPHGGHKRQLIRPRSNNFWSLVWNITKLLHRIELAIPKNPIVFVFRFCYISAGK